MSDPLLYNWDELFNGSDFPGKAMGFFHAVGHTIAETPLIVADDVLRCIYSDLKFKAYYDGAERSAFACISSLSHLFTMDDEAFYKTRNATVQYYSVCVNTLLIERTVIANIIANAFAKSSSGYCVILFRHEEQCMLSFSKKLKSSVTIFSDWFGEANVIDIMRRLDIANLSLQSSDEYIRDLVYFAARRYYTNPISRDYAHAEWANQKLFSDFGDMLVTADPKEFMDELMYSHINDYGDDYVGELDLGDYQTDTIEGSDYDFDLLELEIDEMIASEGLEFENDEYSDEDIEGVIDEYERIYADEIPPEIMDDPVLLLKWLSERERERAENGEGTEDSDIDSSDDDESW